MSGIQWITEKRRLGDLVPRERNPVKISDHDAEHLQTSVERFGPAIPMICQPNGDLIDGHQRQKVMFLSDEYGEDYEIDVRVPSRPLMPEEVDELAMRLRRNTGELDWSIVKENFDRDSLLSWGFTEFDFEAVGWKLDKKQPKASEPQIDKAAKLQEKWSVVQGQIWELGEHFVICGDCREPNTWQRLLDAANIEKINGVFTSPPYAEQRKEHYSGVPTDEYVDWWEAVQENARSGLANDGSFFVNIKPHCESGERVLYVFDLVLAMKRRWGWHLVDELCWTHQGVPGYWNNRFKNGFEPIYQFAINDGIKFIPKNVSRKDSTAFRGKGGGLASYYDPDNATENSIETFYGDVLPSNCIRLNFPSASKEFTGHGAQFPAALPDFFIRAYSDTGDVWLDPFLGSGTTIMAAHQNGRRGLGIEMLEKYVAVTLERWANLANCEPRLVKG